MWALWKKKEDPILNEINQFWLEDNFWDRIIKSYYGKSYMCLYKTKLHVDSFVDRIDLSKEGMFSVRCSFIIPFLFTPYPKERKSTCGS